MGRYLETWQFSHETHGMGVISELGSASKGGQEMGSQVAELSRPVSVAGGCSALEFETLVNHIYSI
jgi:hypothetical protein